jgi:hypothetical protein
MAEGRNKNVFGYKKPVFWITCMMVIVAVAGVVLLLTNPTRTLELPDAATVFSVEMEQVNDANIAGRLVITETEEIKKVLSAMTGARKTSGYSVNDYPAQKNYLVVRLNLEDEMRTLCLYSENGREYIEEPYVGIYKDSKDSGTILAQLYTSGMERSDGSVVDIRWDVSGNIPQAVKNYAVDYVQGQMNYYNSLDYKIRDARITGLTPMNTGTAALTKAISMWQLEYRLLPENANKVVLAGGMQVEDGWLTEWGSTGQPYLVLVCYWDNEAEIWQRVGVTNTLTMQEEYQGDNTVAAMAMYHDFVSRSGITWGHAPGMNTYPALPIRIDIPFSKAHMSVDWGKLYSYDEAKTSNYIDCGKETDYPAGERILWSPSESGILDTNDITGHCMLHFEIFADDGSIHKGIIIVDNFQKEDDVSYYSVILAESDTGLILVQDEEDSSGVILKLP